MKLFKKLIFVVSILGEYSGEGGTSKPPLNIFLLNIDWYQNKLAPEIKPIKKLIFGSSFGGLREGDTPKPCQGICHFIISWYQKE